MKILSVTAQKPHSTGSGIYLTKTVETFARMGHENAVLAGITAADEVHFPPDTAFYPVYYNTPSLPFPVAGMSDEMPYESTVYRNMTEQMLVQFEQAFGAMLLCAVHTFQPDVILCHHLYLLTALVRRMFPDIPVWGICHGTDLRQMYTNPLCREQIAKDIRVLDRICCLHMRQREEIALCYGVDPERIVLGGPGYDDTCFYDRGIRKPHEELRLVYVGKISEKKGVFSLIAALDHLNLQREEFTLDLYGGWNSDAQRDTVQRCIDGSGWDIRLHGRVSLERLVEAYSGADVFVLPSFYEGFALVTIEARACGARAVCTDLPGIRPQMDAFVPGHGVHFVEPPRMLGTDTPDPASLPAFERRLAGAILAAAKEPPHVPDLSGLRWQAVCERILNT